MVRPLLAACCLLTVVSSAFGQGNSPDRVAPEMVGEGVLSTPDDELNTAFTPDGRTVYFSKNLGDRIYRIAASAFQETSGR